jgi:hypothetical protein
VEVEILELCSDLSKFSPVQQLVGPAHTEQQIHPVVTAHQ